MLAMDFERGGRRHGVGTERVEGKRFESEDSRALEMRLREHYEVNGQTAWALLTKTERFRVHIVTKLQEADVRRMRMIPAQSIESVLSQISATTRGHIMPRGGALLPVSG